MAARAALARLRADLADALQRREALEYRHAVARLTSSSSESTDDLDVELAQVEATIAELEEAMAATAGDAAPGPPVPAVDLAAPPANDAPAAAPEPEYVGTREAARLLGVSPRTLEGLRARGEGPPCVRIGKAVRYPLATLRTPAK